MGARRINGRKKKKRLAHRDTRLKAQQAIRENSEKSAKQPRQR